MSGFDVALLRKAVDWAKVEESFGHGQDYTRSKATPDQWFQQIWGKLRLNAKAVKTAEEVADPHYKDTHLAVDQLSCGSTGCIAGHICTLAGDKYLVHRNRLKAQRVIEVEQVVTPEGEVMSISERARELLGITSDFGLFAGGNTVDEVESIARLLAHEYGEEW